WVLIASAAATISAWSPSAAACSSRPSCSLITAEAAAMAPVASSQTWSVMKGSGVGVGLGVGVAAGVGVSVPLDAIGTAGGWSAQAIVVAISAAAIANRATRRINAPPGGPVGRYARPYGLPTHPTGGPARLYGAFACPLVPT